MSALAVDGGIFPVFANHVRAKCAAIIYKPLLGSPESLVVGIIAVNDTGFKVVGANALARLECLYGSAASTALSASEAAIEYAKGQLVRLGKGYLDDCKPILSSVTVSESWEAEGKSLEIICHNWLTSLSSLHDGKRYPSDIQVFKDILADVTAEPVAVQLRPKDKLPGLVMEFVKGRRAEYIKYFSAEIRGDGKLKRGRSHEVVIHYAGPKLVANFGTLRATHIAASVTQIKRHLWDLKVDRDGDPNHTEFTRPHEMFVQRPAENDPQLSDKQLHGVATALAGLTSQADQENIRLRALTNVDEIGKQLVTAELGPDLLG